MPRRRSRALMTEGLDASLRQALPSRFPLDIPALVERALLSQINAGRTGTLSHAQAAAMVDGTAVVRRSPELAMLPLDQVAPIIRHTYTRHVSWALFTQDYFDSLHGLLQLLLGARPDPVRVLEVCAGSGAVMGPMRERGYVWTATDVNPPNRGLVYGAVERCGALAALQAAVDANAVDCVFFAWWSKPKPNKRKQDGEQSTAPEVPEDRRLVELCVKHAIPVIFVSEPEGGITGSAELWRGSGAAYRIRPAAELVPGFVDIARWTGFSDSTYVVVSNIL